MLIRSEIDFRQLDKGILFAMVLLVGIGLLAIYSAISAYNTPVALKANFAKQFIWFVIGVGIMSTVMLLPMKYFHKHAYLFYGIGLLLLVGVLFAGGGKGVHRWFEFGNLKFQPSEIAKIATILAFSRFVSSEGCDLRNYRHMAIAVAIVVVPGLLIFKQPDLGTALVFFSLVPPIMFWAGLSPFIIFVMVSPVLTFIASFNYYTFMLAILLICAVLYFTRRPVRTVIFVLTLNVMAGAFTPVIWNRLHDYQRTRVLTFVGLQQDPQGTGYQVNQSKVAIGSGGFFGKGWQEGSQTQLRFLPEQHTDFVFSVVGEEFGFFGVMVVLGLFFMLLIRALQIAAQTKSKFSSLVVIGCVTTIAFHVVINIGMTVGIAPVTGIPLPFLSYGGSALWTNMVLVGLILNIGMRRFEYL
jgi:rod shape determining protein RodA